jgi:K+-sensing histidine kinase KdpD
MIPADPLPNEDERLAELQRYNILDSPAEQDFDEIVNLASQICGTEISLVSLVDEHRQWFKACKGLETQETERNIAFCTHALHGEEIFEIPDATQDERFQDNPLVTDDPKIRFYAGQPLCSAAGQKLGTLCVIDQSPRQLNEFQRQALRVLGRQVERLLELRLRVHQVEESFQVIEAQNQTLQQLNQVKDQTLLVLSHDLRSPLATLESALNLFQRDYIDGQETTALLQRLYPQVQQQRENLNRLLDWAKAQFQQQEVQKQPLNLSPILQRSAEWVQAGAQNKGVQLKIEQKIEVTVIGDPDLVEVVLRNLLQNAIKYSRQQDTVTLFARNEDEGIRLGVQDNGSGIREEDLAKVLDHSCPFSTLGTAREKGTGLGLLLCQSYLRKMSSFLEVKSRWQQGCTFSFLLPYGDSGKEGTGNGKLKMEK